MSKPTVYHPDFGAGTLLKTYMGGFEWEVLFESGRRFRLPSREFQTDDGAPDRPTFTPLPTQRPAILELDQFRARQTLEALRVGIVPVQDAELLTIGLEPERVTLDRALARTRERSGDVLAVIGDYGYGKSHFIELAARRGLRNEFIVASASLDLMEVPPSKAQKIYESLVTSLRYPDTDRRGLAPLLERAVSHPTAIDQFVALCPREAKDCPVASVLLALRDDPIQQAVDEMVVWLSGQVKAQAEMRRYLKKPPRLYLTGETARQYSYLLTALSTLARLVGYSGMVTLIDESEHYSLLRANQRERADSFFKAMIVGALGLTNGRVDARDIPDNTRAEYPVNFASEPHLFFMFALTESTDRMPVTAWLAASNLLRLDDRFIEKDIRTFFDTLMRYHALAYDYQPDSARHTQVAAQAPELLARALSQHRINLRELIRGAVTVCDLLYLHPDYAPENLLDELKRGLKV